MRFILQLVRIIVGLLFIFSGLIKANDPLGLSYKTQEFFELWGMTRFNDQTLWLSIVLIAFEIIAGAALILGWKPKLNTWLLLLLTLFFTFLTGYALLSGKFKNCGCFGDCLPLTPLQSFIKDIVLTTLIVFLFVNRKFIQPVLASSPNTVLILLITLFSFGIQWYALNYLPVLDCLAYKKGNNIPEKMKIPEGARPDSFAIRFIYSKGGKNFEFAPAELPADLASYTYVSRTDKLIRQGDAEPPIKGFSLSGITDADSTNVVLAHPFTILFFCEDFSTPVNKWSDQFATLVGIAKGKNIPVYVVTNRMQEALKIFNTRPFTNLQVFSCDYTAIRTAARAKPTIYLLEKGTIIDKQSYRRMDQIQKQVEALSIQSSEIASPVDSTLSSAVIDSTNK